MSKRSKFLLNLKQAAEAATQNENVPLRNGMRETKRAPQPRATAAMGLGQVSASAGLKEPSQRPLRPKASENSPKITSPQGSVDIRMKKWVDNVNSHQGNFIHNPSKSPGRKSGTVQPHGSSASKQGNLVQEGSNAESLRKKSVSSAHKLNTEDAISTHNGFSVEKLHERVKEPSKQGPSSEATVRRRLFSNPDSTVQAEEPLVDNGNNEKSPTVPSGHPISLEGAEYFDDVNDILHNIPEGQIFEVPFLDENLNPFDEVQEEGDEAEMNTAEEQLATPPQRKRKYTPPEKLTRKRLTDTRRWKANVAKAELARGAEHLTVRGVTRRGRSLKEGCDETCSFSCTEKITLAERQAIFDQFWRIANQKEKWDFAARHLEVVHTPENKKRKSFVKCFFVVDGVKMQVCQTMFLDTLDMCDSIIKTVKKKLNKGGYISPDKRHGRPRKTTPAMNMLKDKIREHIKLVPRMPSHYSRKDSNKEYINEDYNDCGDLHEEYCLWMAEIHPGEKCGTLRQYRDIFNTEFNISFFCSKKDTCDECTAWKNTPEEERPALEDKFKTHRNNHEIVTAMKDADTAVSRKKESLSCLTVAHFDFEKILICPKGDVSVLYYKRKLSVSNFTVVDVGQYEDNCYVYDETVAKKGSNEVSSFLLHFIQRKAEKGITEIRLYCDNCGGQNKNRNVATLLVYAAAKFNIKIVLKFLVKGHTYNKADNVHSHIEKKTKKCKLYVPQQWYAKIKAAKRTKIHPMNVVEVNQDMVLNWHDLQTKLNLDKDTSGARIPWQSIVQLEASGSPHALKYRTKFEEDLKSVSTKLVGRPVNFTTYSLQKAYSGRLPISKLKYNDLLFYCTKKIIPAEFRNFFQSLPSSDETNENMEEEEQEEPREGRARKRRKPMPKKTTKSKTKTGRRQKVVGEDDSADEENDLSDSD